MSEAGVTLDAPRGRARHPPPHIYQERDMPSLNPYISFQNQARDAMEYYQSVFGGELVVSTFAEYPGMTDDPAEQDLVMHALLETPDGFILMGADTPSRMTYEKPAGISVSVNGDDEPA